MPSILLVGLPYLVSPQVAGQMQTLRDRASSIEKVGSVYLSNTLESIAFISLSNIW
jgi:hypothetical protein